MAMRQYSDILVHGIVKVVHNVGNEELAFLHVYTTTHLILHYYITCVHFIIVINIINSVIVVLIFVLPETHQEFPGPIYEIVIMISSFICHLHSSSVKLFRFKPT